MHNSDLETFSSSPFRASSNIYYLFVLSTKTSSSLGSDLGLLSQSSETLDGGLGRNGKGSRELISATSDLLVSSLAVPDADGGSFDSILSAEWRHVSGVLGDFKLLDDLSQGSTISGSVLSTDSDFLSSLCHDLILDIK